MKQTTASTWSDFADFLWLGFFRGDQVAADERHAMTTEPTHKAHTWAEACLGRRSTPGGKS